MKVSKKNYKKQERERQAKIPKLTDEGKQNIKGIYKSETKRVFLTFDDGPSVNTADVLDILKSNDIKSYIFCIRNTSRKNARNGKKSISRRALYCKPWVFSSIFTNIFFARNCITRI